MTATHAQRIARAVPVIWYLEQHPMEYDAISTLAHLEATMLGITLYEAGAFAVCHGCGSEKLISSYHESGEPLCRDCER